MSSSPATKSTKRTPRLRPRKNNWRTCGSSSATWRISFAPAAAIPAGLASPCRPSQHLTMEPLLLVEDKNELRAMLRKALERNGHSVDEATDGSAAIQKLRNRRYQMVLTDLKMPGASGLDVLRESKQADAT